MDAGQQLGLTGVAITNSIKDCKFTEQEQRLTASTCAADIESAGEDLWDVTTKIVSAVNICKDSDKAKCSEVISEVVKELATASTDVEDAVSDCGGASTQCAKEISTAATDLASASEDVSKAVDDCASSANSDCMSDIMDAGKQLGLTGVEITNAISDCKATESIKVEGNACAKDIAGAGKALSSTAIEITKASVECKTDPTECAAEISRAVGFIGTATTDITQAVSDCGYPSIT